MTLAEVRKKIEADPELRRVAKAIANPETLDEALTAVRLEEFVEKAREILEAWEQKP